MISSAYLDMLDDSLRPGIAGLSERFKAAQIDFVASRQQPDGGFSGRQGGADLYYTDFALRTLAWLAPEHAAFDRAAGYVANLPHKPRTVVECFNYLNVRRLLERHGSKIADKSAWQQTPSLLIDGVRQYLLPGGGFSRFVGDARASAYHTFLGSLCFQMLGEVMPAIDGAVFAVNELHRPDGGYAEMAEQRVSQTNATAAAVGFLVMHDALPAESMTDTAGFLAKMQSADGGLKAHAAVGAGDLLSTFTGLLTLSSLGRFGEIDAGGAARFLQSTADADGGFLACESDNSADVEYTHYGVATLALLRVLAGND
jgi:geranylgeranyl transferase type-2 subunit beta